MLVSSTTKAPRVSTGLPGLVSNSLVVRKREVGPVCLHSHVPARPTCRSVGLTEVSVPSQKCPLGQTEPSLSFCHTRTTAGFVRQRPKVTTWTEGTAAWGSSSAPAAHAAPISPTVKLFGGGGARGCTITIPVPPHSGLLPLQGHLLTQTGQATHATSDVSWCPEEKGRNRLT